MNIYKIFLASSSELENDRKEFEILINRKNKDWVNKGVHLDLVIWEDFLDCLSDTRLQDEYNKEIKKCDFFVLLYCHKVGKYTLEEFMTAYELFKETGKPKIYTYYMNPLSHPEISINKVQKTENQKSLTYFQKQLLEIGHFETQCSNTESFLLKFSQQLDKLSSNGYIQFTPLNSSKYNRTLTLPPFKPEIFLGREDDLSAIHEKLFLKNTQLLLISGEGGLGKTSLASEYYHTYAQEYNHTVWILSENNIADALLSSLSKPLGVVFEPIKKKEERLDELLLLMSSLAKPCLLIIDNVDEVNDLEENYLILRRLANFHILITTRLKRFHNAAIYSLQTLNNQFSLDLFTEYYPYHNHADDELFYKIRDAVDGNTLVLEILAKNLSILNQIEHTYTLKDMLFDIQSKGLLSSSESDTEKLETTYHAGSKMKYAKPSELISTMYDLGRLSQEEIMLLSHFAILPPDKIDFHTFLALTDPAISPESTLKSLSQKGWIDYSSQSMSFKCSPVIQDIIKIKNTNLYRDSQYLLDTLVKKLEYDSNLGHPLHISMEEAILWIHYGESIVKNLAIQNQRDCMLCDRIGRYFQTTGDLEKALYYFRLSNQKYNDLVVKNPNDSIFLNYLAISYQNLGAIYTNRGDLKQALEDFMQFYKIRNELAKKYPDNIDYKNGLAISYSKLGDIYTNIGELNNALKYYTLYNQLRENLTSSYPENLNFKNGLAISYCKLGDIYTKNVDYNKAQEYFIKFHSLTKELYQSNPENVGYNFWLALSAQNLTTNYINTGNLDLAYQYGTMFQELIAGLHKKYPQDTKYKYGVAVAYEHLGDIFESKNDLEKSLDCYAEDLRIAQELYKDFPSDVVYKNVLATANERLGNLYRKQINNQELGFQYLKVAMDLWTELTQSAPYFKEYSQSLERVKSEILS